MNISYGQKFNLTPTYYCSADAFLTVDTHSEYLFIESRLPAQNLLKEYLLVSTQVVCEGLSVMQSLT